MTGNETRICLLYGPLWGCSFDSEETGLVGGRVMAYIPFDEEWRLAQKTDVWMARFGHDPYNLQGPRPPLCLVRAESPVGDENLLEIIKRAGNEMVSDLEDASLALRLSKPGWFLDPELAERTFSYNGFYQRALGPYRQAFMAGMPDGMPSGYVLSVNDLATHAGQETFITRNWQLVHMYREDGRHSAADIAIENFNRSYGYQLPGTGRAAFLFTALEAILGGMSAKQIGPASLKNPFRKRVKTALEIARDAGPGFTADSDEEADWLDGEGRRIRNAIAHGQPASVDQAAYKTYERLQAVVRALLHQYLVFSLNWAEDRNEISGRLGLTFDTSPSAVYNLLLEAQAGGQIEQGDYLRIQS